MMLHRMIFDDVSCDTKEKALRRIPYFKKHMPKAKMISTEEIIYNIKHGYMYTTGELKENTGKHKKTKNYVVYRSVFAFDIDNKDNSVSFVNIKRLLDKNHLHMFFAYKTYSYTNEKPRYRILFAFNKGYGPMYCKRIYRAIYLLINSKHKGVIDTSCFDDSRTFFSCSSDKDILFEDPYAVTYIYQIHDIYQEILAYNLEQHMNDSSICYLTTLKSRLTAVSSRFSTKFRSILMSRSRTLKQEPSEPLAYGNRTKTSRTNVQGEGEGFLSLPEAPNYSIDLNLVKKNGILDGYCITDVFIEFLLRLDLRKLLGVGENNFNCIFKKHKDRHPSAFIILDDNKRNYYVCNSCSKSRLTIIEVTKRLLQEITPQFKLHNIDAYYWLLDQLRMTNDNLRFRNHNIDEYRRCVGNKELLKTISEPLYKKLTRGSGIHLTLLNYLLSKASDMAYNRGRFGVPYLYVTVSVRYLTEHLKEDKKLSYGSVHNSLTLLNHLGLIEKVPDDELSEYVTKKLKVGTKSFRHISMYRIPIYSMALIKKAEYYLNHKEAANLSSDTSVSRRYYRDNKTELKRHFGQYKDMYDLDDDTIDIQTLVFRFLMGHILHEGYLSVQNLINYVSTLKSCSISSSRVFVSSFVPGFIDKYNLTCVVYKKSVRDKLKITERLHPGTSKIICKL